MQAATPARRTSVDATFGPSARPDASPRVDASRVDRREAFARHLFDARSAPTRPDREAADPSKPTLATDRGEPVTKTPRAERADAERRVRKTESRADAAEQPSDASKAGAPTQRPAKAAKAEDDAALEADVELVPAAEAKKEPLVALATPIDLALALAAAPVTATAPEEPAVATDERDPATVVAAVAVVVTVAGALDVDETPVATPAQASIDAAGEPIVAKAALANAPKPDVPQTSAAIEAPVDAYADVVEAATTDTADARDSQQQGEAEANDESPFDGGDAAPTPTASTRAEAAERTFDALLAKLAPVEPSAARAAEPTPALPAVPAERRFAEENLDQVVKSVRTQVTAGGGEMRMRLDPPELGALDVAVKMLDGRMTASFTTSNDQATQLLSHSLNDLKTSLEASGISVDRIQVRQASAGNDAQQQPGNDGQKREGGAFDQPSQRGDQQRKEAVEKMWRKLAYGSDELDFVA